MQDRSARKRWRGQGRSLSGRIASLLGAVAIGLTTATALAQSGAPPAGPADKRAVAGRHMVAAAHPLAAEAGLEILRKGGSAVDAAIAVQLVLTLVEPQSSGIGGGGFLLHWNASRGEVETYDGRETAPERAAPDMFLDERGEPLAFDQAAIGGIAVATPGLLRMLEQAHQAHGRLPWGRLFEPAMRLAEDGFPISPRLNRAIATDPQLKDFAATAAHFYDDRGDPRESGSRLANPVLAETLRLIANGGADAFYTGAIARDIEAAVKTVGSRPGWLTQADLAAYRPAKRAPLCGTYRGYRVCGMGPPSAGGIALLQILSLLSPFDLKAHRPNSLRAVHLIAEASRLAFADRGRYLADPAHVAVPVHLLLDPAYLSERSKLIRLDRSLGRAEPGILDTGPLDLATPLGDDGGEGLSTSHVSVVDGAGNAVALTSSIMNSFGSRVFVRGFLLNSQMSDFAFRPTVGERPLANRIEPGKRPRSSMAPTLVFTPDGKLLMTLGSAGGSRLIGYVARTLVATLDWGLDPQAAIALPHHVTMNGPTLLERNTPIVELAPRLQAIGHAVEQRRLASGLQAILVERKGDETHLIGAADPRREGVALGD